MFEKTNTLPCLIINLLIAILILIITVACSTIVMMTCKDDCHNFIYALIPMCILSLSLLGFTIWCITYVRKEEKQLRSISFPIMHAQQPITTKVHDEIKCNAQYKSNDSIQSSSRSGYDYYRKHSEFEKRLMLEPRYIQDEASVRPDQYTVHNSQVRLARTQYSSQGGLSVNGSTTTYGTYTRQCPTCSSQVFSSRRFSPLMTRQTTAPSVTFTYATNTDTRYQTSDSFTYQPVHTYSKPSSP